MRRRNCTRKLKGGTRQIQDAVLAIFSLAAVEQQVHLLSRQLLARCPQSLPVRMPAVLVLLTSLIKVGNTNCFSHTLIICLSFSLSVSLSLCLYLSSFLSEFVSRGDGDGDCVCVCVCVCVSVCECVCVHV